MGFLQYHETFTSSSKGALQACEILQDDIHHHKGLHLSKRQLLTQGLGLDFFDQVMLAAITLHVKATSPGFCAAAVF